jgi:hypothetical protein
VKARHHGRPDDGCLEIAQHAVIDDGRGMRCLVRFWPSLSRTGAVEVEPGLVVGALILIFLLIVIFDN